MVSIAEPANARRVTPEPDRATLWFGQDQQAPRPICHRPRTYNPTIGRFNRLDPYSGSMDQPLSLHKYNYAHANPVMLIDPSGELSIGEVAGAIFNGTLRVLNQAKSFVSSQVLARPVALGATTSSAFVALSLLAGGNVQQVLRASAFGLSAGFVVGQARNTGRSGEVIGAGLLGGVINFLVDGLSDLIRVGGGRSAAGQPPSKAKYLDSFFQGFAFSSAEALLSPDNELVTALAASGFAGFQSIANDILSGEVPSVGAAASDAAITGIIALLTSPGVISSLRPGLGAKGAETLIEEIGALGAATLTIEIGVLIQLYLP